MKAASLGCAMLIVAACNVSIFCGAVALAAYIVKHVFFS